MYTLLSNSEYKELLKKVTFYILPRANPDGTECVLTTHSPAVRSRIEILDVKNGLIPEDINGDGHILQMRWKNPLGKYKKYSGDPRIMVRREPGDEGPFYNVETEGIINDYDGSCIVNGFRTLDFNRNYAVGWKDIDISGKYPFSENETRAIAEFGKTHPNIFAGIDLHNGTQAIMRPALIDENNMNQEDLGLMIKLGKIAENITGFPFMKPTEYKQTWKKAVNWPGNSKDWFYYNLGISFFTVELGNGFSSSGIFAEEYFNADDMTRTGEFMAQVLKAHDKKNSKIFVPWEECEHPQLGKVEVGGIIDSNAYYMYPPYMESISPKVISFMIEHSKYHPELAICNVEKKAVGEDVYRIRATVGNIGGFSTKVMNDGGCHETKIPVRVKISKREGVLILSRPSFYEIDNLSSLGGTTVLEWFIKAEKGSEIEITAFHPRGGKVVVKCVI